MNNNNNDSAKVGLFIGIMIICFIVLAAMANSSGKPKCASAGCNNERANGSIYCYLHSTYGSSSGHYSNNSSSGHYSNSGSSGSRGTSGTGSTNSSVNKGTSGGSSSSTSHKTYSNYHDSYDDGYNDVYEEDDYDWDRYYRDDDYASGVDDALEDMEDDGEDY